jgi:hypothetical protein
MNLYLNSYYTKEFFEAARKILNNNGFLALTLPGKKVFLLYLTSELNASVFKTLKENFNYVKIISFSGKNAMQITYKATLM